MQDRFHRNKKALIVGRVGENKLFPFQQRGTAALFCSFSSHIPGSVLGFSNHSAEFLLHLLDVLSCRNDWLYTDTPVFGSLS